jgi:hypothetical protein
MDRSTYLERLASGLAWGLSTERPAWARTMERIDHSRGSYRREDLELIRTEASRAVTAAVVAWFGPIYEALEPGVDIPDLEQSPEDIWCGMVCMNEGIFAQPPGPSPLSPLVVTLASTVRGEGPLYLSLNLDGWGIADPLA